VDKKRFDLKPEFMNCSFHVGKGEDEKECDRPAKEFVTVEFEDKGKTKQETFGYCSRHWKIVHNYYKHLKRGGKKND